MNTATISPIETSTPVMTKELALDIINGKVWSSYFSNYKDFMDFGPVDDQMLRNWNYISRLRTEIDNKRKNSISYKLMNLFSF